MNDTAAPPQRSQAPERRLILLAASTRERREAQAEEMRSLAANVDWDRLVNALRARHLLASLGPRLVPFATDEEEIGATVEGAIEAGRRQSAFLQLVARSAVAALAEAEIPAVTLKGPDLGEAIYGDPGKRLSGDVDLLVPPGSLARAVEVVQGLGYGAPGDPTDGDGLPLLHFALLHAKGDLPPIELHWRIHWYETAFAAERLLPPDAGSAAGWRPCPRDQLAALLLYYARDGFLDLRLAADLAAWWDRFGGELDPGALAEVSGSYPALGPPIRAGALAAERVVGLPAAGLLGSGRAGRRERLAVRLADPFPRVGEKQAYAEMSLVDGLLAPPGSLGTFLRRQLVAPAERGHADEPAGEGGLAFMGRFLRRCGIFFRFAVAIGGAFTPRRP